MISYTSPGPTYEKGFTHESLFIFIQLKTNCQGAVIRKIFQCHLRLPASYVMSGQSPNACFSCTGSDKYDEIHPLLCGALSGVHCFRLFQSRRGLCLFKDCQQSAGYRKRPLLLLPRGKQSYRLHPDPSGCDPALYGSARCNLQYALFGKHQPACGRWHLPVTLPFGHGNLCICRSAVLAMLLCDA